MPSHPALAPTFTRVSIHARSRMSQRGIPSELLQILFWHGAESSCGSGSIALMVDDDVASELQADGIRAAQVERLRRLRAIVSNDGELVTVMHRYKRHRGFRARQTKGAQ